MVSEVERAWQLLAEVPDPELPTLSVVDLGIARSVRVDEDGTLVVGITPTYSGCPALVEITRDVRARLVAEFDRVEVRTELAPPWSTDWITEEGHRKLAATGIAPPSGRAALPLTVLGDRPLSCPRCAGVELEELAAFGSTACKALWRCRSCREPFDYLKRH